MCGIRGCPTCTTSSIHWCHVITSGPYTVLVIIRALLLWCGTMSLSVEPRLGLLCSIVRPNNGLCQLFFTSFMINISANVVGSRARGRFTQAQVIYHAYLHAFKERIQHLTSYWLCQKDYCYCSNYLLMMFCETVTCMYNHCSVPTEMRSLRLCSWETQEWAKHHSLWDTR